MENASKALLIAGAILIAILLIALEVRVFDSTLGTTNSVETTFNATEIATFNNKFIIYVGSGKSASQVKALANVIISNNATNQEHKVSFNGSFDATVITNDAASRTGASYTISPVYDSNGAYIVGLTIS